MEQLALETMLRNQKAAEQLARLGITMGPDEFRSPHEVLTEREGQNAIGKIPEQPDVLMTPEEIYRSTSKAPPAHRPAADNHSPYFVR